MKLLKPLSFLTILATLLPVMMVFVSQAQEKAVVYGHVTDTKKTAVELVNISIAGLPSGSRTDKSGYYELSVPAGKPILLIYSFIAYKTDTVVMTLRPGERRKRDMVLNEDIKEIKPFEFIEKNEQVGITRINPKDADYIPSVSGSGIEELVKRASLGVYSNNELSSQYSVRGGNFDENLVYVNDIEVYRPFLTRSGQQEGLSFVNSDLTSNVQFSSGGFEAKYGDKMSSVLDIQYKKPKKFGGSVNLSLLGATAHVEGASDNERFTFLLGVRQKSNQYLLNALETQGQYKPSFTDVQLYTTYQINENWEIGFLGNYARNKYLVVPESRETQFGTIKESYQLKIYFDGQEVDRIQTYFGALTATNRPNKNLKLKYTVSAFTTDESEMYDIQGQYYIGKLETDFSKDEFGDVKQSLGVGSDMNHARNNLIATVVNAEHRGALSKGKSFIQWGAKYQVEIINDRLKEWRMLDSAGFTQPRQSDSVGYTNPALQPENALVLQDVVNTTINLNSNRYSGFVQNTWTFEPDSAKILVTVGGRAQYWDFNKQLLFSPRASITFVPHWKNNWSFRFSTGYYYQPPFYKELRGLDGVINHNLKAQTSIHALLGAEWNFKAWERPFKLVTEVYYKYLDNLIPYEIDNVRLRYFATNNAHGYATGLDFKINGEFVKDVESWFGFSLMQTREDITDDYYYAYYDSEGKRVIPGYNNTPIADTVKKFPGYIPRPTDQFLNVNLFFQDHLPKNPTYKMHLNFVYASPLPFGPPSHNRYQDTLRMPSYFRVDVGFSKELLLESNPLPKKNPFHIFRSIWISAEVFNLLGRLNTISYIWVKDVYGRQYAVPNELTRRLINVKLIAKF
ncbi:MAG: carboxypeptidase-like regulatory domain-containing protein [Bacteroidota bacterium]